MRADRGGLPKGGWLPQRFWPCWKDVPLDLRALALFRLALGGASLVEVTELISHRAAFLNPNGVCPVEHIANKAMFDFYLAATGSEGVLLMLLINMTASLCFMLGLWTRLSGLLCWIFAMSQQHRLNNCVNYSGDALRTCLLFWALFQPLNEVWSLDAIAESSKRRVDPETAQDKVESVRAPAPNLRERWRTTASSNMGAMHYEEGEHHDDRKDARPSISTAAPMCSFLLLLQLASMYEYTAATKVGTTWQQGTAVLQTLHLRQFAREPVAGMLALFPSLCRLLTHSTWYVEKFGWMLAFMPYPLARMVAFCLFFGLHFGMNLALRVGNFQLFAMSGWLVVLPRGVLDWLEARLLRSWPATRALGPREKASTRLQSWLGLGVQLIGFALMLLTLAEGCRFRGEKCSLRRLAHWTPKADMWLAKLALNQRWNMFSPDAPFKSLRVELFGILDAPHCRGDLDSFWQHCPVVELWSEKGYPSFSSHVFADLPHWGNISMPAPKRVDFATNRWRKLVEDVDHSMGLGGYSCLQWRANNPKRNLLGVWLVRARSKVPEEETLVGAFRHWCSPAAKPVIQSLPKLPWVS
ncbi:unnamed protein product [Symbiodinium natans]|uniref:HTTM-like domain-containing protein n=1 Tax=Symbiodinium natans TaxID=878477 RepID=A0A812KSH6_9DINO|nr:unnamed protein product [Symbiodinium natans]